MTVLQYFVLDHFVGSKFERSVLKFNTGGKKIYIDKLRMDYLSQYAIKLGCGE